MSQPQLLFFTQILSFALGACVGSFLNVVIFRLPEEKSIVFPGSHCPACNTPILWRDNIPILGFIFLRARCRSCGVAISWQYPLVELAMALLSLGLFKIFGLSFAFLIYFVFCAALLAIIVIDFHHQIIPDAISLPGIVIGFLCSFVNPLLNWKDAGLGVLIGGGTFYLIAYGYYLFTKREGMGGGDIKLLAMIGAFLGWQSLFFVIFASALMGSIAGIGAMVRQRKGGKTVIPYGPFLAIACYIFLFFRPKVMNLMGFIFFSGR